MSEKLGIDKIEELKDELLEFFTDVAKIMEDKTVDLKDAIAIASAAKDGYDVYSVIGEAYLQIKDIDKEESPKCLDMLKEFFEGISKLFGLKSLGELLGIKV